MQNHRLAADAPVDFKLIETEVIGVCLACHAGGQPPQLSGYAAVTSHITAIWGEINAGTMPPASSGMPRLSVCQQALFIKWMDSGIPQTGSVLVAQVPECANESGDAPKPPAPPHPLPDEPLNYQTLLTRILQPRCLRCHNATSRSGAREVLFGTYAELMRGE